MIVWITKYALTRGILEARTDELPSEGIVAVHWPGGLNGRAYFHGKDWHTSLEAAQARVEAMIEAKLKALEKKQAKLQTLILALRQNSVRVTKC